MKTRRIPKRCNQCANVRVLRIRTKKNVTALLIRKKMSQPYSFEKNVTVLRRGGARPWPGAIDYSFDIRHGGPESLTIWPIPEAVARIKLLTLFLLACFL